MLKGKIEFTGDSLTDVENAIERALELIHLEFTSGQDSNDTGSFTFEVTES